VNDAVLPATTYRKACLGREGQSPHEGEQIHLAGSGVHAQDLVPNPTASGLIACTSTCYICVLTMQSRNQFVLPPMSRERSFQVLIGEDRKTRSSDCFSVLASSGLILPCI
jgi:hypothetical protein